MSTRMAPLPTEAENKKNAVTKEEFNDKITVHTAPSGTQYVNVIDILLNDDAWESMARLSQIVTEQNAQRDRKE